jgi:hypothetical protein
MGSDNHGGRGRGGGEGQLRAAFTGSGSTIPHPIFYRRPGRFRKVSFREKARTSALRTLMSDHVA